MNKLTLKLELDLDFKLLGITCQLKDYRLCYHINKFTGLQLAKTEDHEVDYLNKQILFFSRYIFIPPMAETEYYLLANRGINGGFLIPEMRGADYFFLIRNFIDDENFATLHHAISGIKDVLTATEIEPHKLKSKENLVF
ncbi:hypothetical protein SAMN05216436_12241 [bacterium A37T11]|nr:hypothetical protein SAMN05216436_12241 [bacterium A37T11]